MRDISVLKQYIRNVSKFPRVTPEEEKELAVSIKKGDRTAFDKLVNANLKLVVKIAMQLCRGHSNIMDVIQNGNLGLIRATGKFDPERGVRFSTYSAFWIKQSIMRGFIKPNSGVNISYRKDEVNKKLKVYIREFLSKEGKLPSVGQIVKDMKVKRSDAIDVLMFSRQSGESLLTGTGCESNDELLECVQDNSYNPETVLEEKLLCEEVKEAIDSFPERENEIIRKRYGFDVDGKETLTELGDKYSISAEATRQIEKRVLAAIKNRYPGLANYYFAA
jgi:RNA polymerase nonessential primary-like sigma factor